MDNAQAQQLSALTEKLDSRDKMKLYAIFSELLQNKNTTYAKLALVYGLYLFNLYKYITVKKGYKPLKAIIAIVIIQFVLSMVFVMFPSASVNIVYYAVNYWYFAVALFAVVYYFYVRRITPNQSQNLNQ